METESEAADARRALDEIAQVRTRASARRRTPMWMWHLLGGLMFGYLVMLALPKGWSSWVPLVVLGVFSAAAALYARRAGAALFARDRRARRIGRVVSSVEIVVLLVAVIVFLRGGGAWVLFVAGAINYGLIVIAGPMSERGIEVPTRPVT